MTKASRTTPADFSKNCLMDCCASQEIRIAKVLTKKPIIGTEDEIKENPRSRSAKLRIAEKKNVEESGFFEFDYF